MRYRQGEPGESRYVYRPMAPDHPCYDELCPACGDPLGGGRYLRLRSVIRILEMDVEDSYKYKAGRWINVPAEIIHDKCAKTMAEVVHGRTVTVVKTDV